MFGDRFFWLALYAQPALWVGLAIFALVRFENAIWLALIGQYHHSEFSWLCSRSHQTSSDRFDLDDYEHPGVF